MNGRRKGHKPNEKTTGHTTHMVLYLIKFFFFSSRNQGPIWILSKLGGLGDYRPPSPPAARPGKSTVSESRVLTRIFADKKEEDAKHWKI